MELGRGCSATGGSGNSTKAGPRNSSDLKQHADETIKGDASLGEEKNKTNMVLHDLLHMPSYPWPSFVATSPSETARALPPCLGSSALGHYCTI